MLRLFGIRLDLAPQLGDVRIHGAAEHGSAVPPNLLHQLEAGGDRTIAPDEREQQRECLRCELDIATVAADPARLHIDDDVAEAQVLFPSMILAPRMPPKQEFDALEQFHQSERLCQVLIGAGAEAAHLVGLLAARGEHQDGRREAIAPELLEHFEAVHAGEHDIEDEQIGFRGARGGQTAGTILRMQNREAFDLEIVPDRGGELDVVFDQQDPLERGGAQTASP